MSSIAHPRYDRRRLALLVTGGLCVVALAGAASLALGGFPSSSDAGNGDGAATTTSTTGTTGTSIDTGTDTVISTEGLLTYRGDPTRSYYGEGPVPQDPHILWTYPASGEALCGLSTVGDETREWCGTGWTGQPLIFGYGDTTWTVFGAYDHRVHFLDLDSGEQVLPPFQTGDLVKGSETVDPDGFPLVYTGSRDDRLRVVAIDRPEPEELWSLHAEDVAPTMWNTDWDGAPLVVDDHMYVGGENSQFHIVRLNRSYDDDGLVRVDPELVFNTPGWDEELLDDLSASDVDPSAVSIESSVALHDGVAYFANSGGLVQGWDVSGIAEGEEPTQVFRFWTGDDTDATITIDEDGLLYVAVEYERGLERADEVGQFVVLDPERDDPVVWSFHDPSPVVPRGFWATPALHRDLVIIPSHAGVAYGLDRETGDVRWEIDYGHQTWSSPVVVDDVWIQGSCDETLRAYDLSDTTVEPEELWSVTLTGCIESTPAVWDGRIVVGTRAGRIYALGDV
jgi:outer membrane protein assembly factor BamB